MSTVASAEGDRHEAAVELVPELGEPVVLPAQRLAGVAEGEPEEGGADEDVLDRGLELPGAGGGDHDPAALGPPAEPGHRELAADQQQADPERNAAPDRDVVEVVPGAGDPVDRDEGGEEQQLVGERIEQLAEVGDQVAAAGEVAVDDVGDGGEDENRRSR